eukprot:4276608-Amphidinium_carterae.2
MHTRGLAYVWSHLIPRGHLQIQVAEHDWLGILCTCIVVLGAVSALEPVQSVSPQRPYGAVVLDNVSFDVLAGEKLGIVGRPGSGKSTVVPRAEHACQAPTRVVGYAHGLTNRSSTCSGMLKAMCLYGKHLCNDLLEA